MNNTRIALGLLLALATAPLASADVTSPSIKDKGKKYTHEKPNSSYYGTGSAGRLVEASELRIHIDDLLAAGDWEKAVPKARKAVQLDPGDPYGHLLLARAMTMKLYQSKGEVDEKLLIECMHEWAMIRRHDADPTEQWEAGTQYKKLQKIAKALEKQKKEKEKEKEGRNEETASKDKEEEGGAESKVAESKGSSTSTKSTSAGSTETSKKQLAERKKRFGLF